MQSGAGGDDVFEHAALVLHRGAHAFAEHPRHVDPHQGGGDGVFVDQHDAQAEICGLDGGGYEGGAGADDDEGDMVLDGEIFPGNRRWIKSRHHGAPPNC